MYNPKPSHLRAALVALIAAMLVACLWPFNFRPSNNVRWLQGEPGVRFSGLGSIVSRDTFPSISRLSRDGSITVELAVQPQRILRNGVPYLLAFHRESGPYPLVIGAWKNSLIVRLGTAGDSGGQGYREVGVRNVFTADKRCVITVVTGTGGTSLYVNGALQQLAPHARMEGVDAELGRLALGAPATASSAWHGDILGLKIYDHALPDTEVQASYGVAATRRAAAATTLQAAAEYDFSEGTGHTVHDRSGHNLDLVIPSVFQPLRRAFLSSPTSEFRWTRCSLFDIVLNLLGFVPFALLAMWNMRGCQRLTERQKSILVVLSGFLLSLAIELAQGFLPTRSSSVTDLLANTTGAVAGVLIFFALAAAPRDRHKAGRLLKT